MRLLQSETDPALFRNSSPTNNNRDQERDAPRQDLVLGRARDIVEGQMRRTLEQVRQKNGAIAFFNILVYAMGEEGINPALGSEKWFWIKNPFVDCIGADQVLDTQRMQLERKYGVKFDIDL